MRLGVSARRRDRGPRRRGRGSIHRAPRCRRREHAAAAAPEDDGQAMVEVSTEVAVTDRALEIDRCRRNEGDVNRLSSRALEPAHCAVLQNAQELSLQRDRQQADFIEEQRAAMSGLEQAGLRLARIGESPTLVAKSSASSRVSGMAAQLMSTRRTRRGAGSRPDGLSGQQALTCAGFTQDQDGREAPAAWPGGRST